MRTLADVKHAFTPCEKLSEGQKARLMKLQFAFLNMAEEIMDLVPECPDRTAAVRKLLECKFTAVQAITHMVPFAPASTKEEKHDSKSKK